MKECPVMNEHVPAIIDMRRSLVMMESNFPAELQGTFSNLETNGTPWAFSQAERADWAEGSGVKTATENPEFDVLFWVGCAGSFDDRARKISLAFSKLMQSAGINFSILGTEEQCTGDSARRAGNEYLADMLIKANIETLSRYNVKKIVTTCPHCFNTIKNEFPDFGGKYEVVHHTQFLQQLITDKKLKISPDGIKAMNVAYHDSCYLGRYNEEYTAPRQVISSIPGLRILEPKRTADKGFCCGAGGAQMFMEETQGKRVNIERTEELLATGAKDIAVNCPFCMTMITDGVKAKEREDVRVRDISEILLEHIQH
jgi:Fe-S oxidoreductase